jgi:hypothetical protein
MSVKLELAPIVFGDAVAFIAEHHRHHIPTQGWKFGLGAVVNEKIVGVVTVGRPVARYLDNGWTLEVTRCCTDGTKNACSFLYGAAWRATKSLGYRKLITYTLASEGGASLRAAGWCVIGERGVQSWCRKSRPRIDKHPKQQKLLWEAASES